MVDIEGAVSRAAMSEEERVELEAQLRRVMEQAPSDAFAEFMVVRSSDGYKGYLKIYSRQRKFVGGCSGKKLREVVETIFSEIRSQIDSWRRERFREAADTTL
jgi:hypothetical protein